MSRKFSDENERAEYDWDELRRMWIKCRLCGTKWHPMAGKWRTDGDQTGKTLHCPKCNAINKIPKQAVDFLMKQAREYSEIGFDDEEEPAL